MKNGWYISSNGIVHQVIKGKYVCNQAVKPKVHLDGKHKRLCKNCVLATKNPYAIKIWKKLNKKRWIKKKPKWPKWDK